MNKNFPFGIAFLYIMFSKNTSYICFYGLSSKTITKNEIIKEKHLERRKSRRAEHNICALHSRAHNLPTQIYGYLYTTITIKITKTF